ncbi:MAG: hypothetical protein AVDCRST_MAG40-1335, partial [uncultured Gemmatimonadaceae bacterium]
CSSSSTPAPARPTSAATWVRSPAASRSGRRGRSAPAESPRRSRPASTWRRSWSCSSSSGPSRSSRSWLLVATPGVATS